MNGDEVALPAVTVEPGAVELAEAPESISVSLKYWHGRSQCLSDWRQKELSALRKFIDKVQGMTEAEIKNDPGLGLTPHRSEPRGHGFSRHLALSRDINLVEMRVSGKARVHGALMEGIFYLVWLDRNHAVFPD